ncbi:putative protein [Arabidopsis thaliana]|uniref:Uncharacterized protein F12E4_140 n=1 Tax=Arabidopsis thaliana TaxID=3702 RepID=Q9LZE9_ARATH|nr:uncharacterized protein AT5G03400 [Arabidopsis thaliana]AED90597.1 hypothetical protein AT5G03400 [Arabidopsis thaliana]CAB83297.1 putative protein [Arabidopsis thaliana]|eukprot:NP_195960.1 hypothetical protein AT5G03400 [Arabidopsis thaliana]
MNIDSDYGYKKWKMKRRGEEDSELERALMIIDEEMEIWAKKKEVKDEVDDECLFVSALTTHCGESGNKIQEAKRLEFVKRTVAMKNESEYWFKKWEMKKQSEEDSDVEIAQMMSEEEIEIWAKEKEAEAEGEADEGKVWGLKEKTDYWEERKVHFVTEAKYWEIMYGYLS